MIVFATSRALDPDDLLSKLSHFSNLFTKVYFVTALDFSQQIQQQNK
jgi:hypothetical protein